MAFLFIEITLYDYLSLSPDLDMNSIFILTGPDENISWTVSGIPLEDMIFIQTDDFV
jgi:hypothetical protein